MAPTKIYLLTLSLYLATLEIAAQSDLASLQREDSAVVTTISDTAKSQQARRLFPTSSVEDSYTAGQRDDQMLKEEVKYAHSINDNLMTASSQSEQRVDYDPYQLVPKEFHQFLDIPIHKYKNGTEIRSHQRPRTPLVSGGYANTQVQGFGNTNRVHTERKSVTHRPLSYDYQLATASPRPSRTTERRRIGVSMNNRRIAAPEKADHSLSTMPTTAQTTTTAATTTERTTTTSAPITTATTATTIAPTYNPLPLQDSFEDDMIMSWQQREEVKRAENTDSHPVDVEQEVETAQVVTPGSGAGFGSKTNVKNNQRPLTVESDISPYTTDNRPNQVSQPPEDNAVHNINSFHQGRPSLYETLALGKKPLNNRRRPFLPSDRVFANQRPRPFAGNRFTGQQTKHRRPATKTNYAPTTRPTTTITTTQEPSYTYTSYETSTTTRAPQIEHLFQQLANGNNRRKASLSSFLSGAIERQTTTEKFGLLDQFPTFDNQFAKIDENQHSSEPALTRWEEKQQTIENPSRNDIDTQRVYENVEEVAIPQQQYNEEEFPFNLRPGDAQSFTIHEQFQPEQYQQNQFRDNIADFVEPNHSIQVPERPTISNEEQTPSFEYESNNEPGIDFKIPNPVVDSFRDGPTNNLLNRPTNLRPPQSGRIPAQRPILRRPPVPPTSAPGYFDSILSWFRTEEKPMRPKTSIPQNQPQFPQAFPPQPPPGRLWSPPNKLPPQFVRQPPANNVFKDLQPPASEYIESEYAPQISAKLGALQEDDVQFDRQEVVKQQLPNILPRFRPNINQPQYQQPVVQRRRGRPNQQRSQVNTLQMSHGALSPSSVPQLLRAAGQHRHQLTPGSGQLTPSQMAVLRGERPVLSSFTPMNPPVPGRGPSFEPPQERHVHEAASNMREAPVQDLMVSESRQASIMETIPFAGAVQPDSAHTWQLNAESRKSDDMNRTPAAGQNTEHSPESAHSPLQFHSNEQQFHPEAGSGKTDNFLVNVGASSSYRIAEPDEVNGDHGVLISGSVQSEPLPLSSSSSFQKQSARSDSAETRRKRRSVSESSVTEMHVQDQLEFLPVTQSS